MPHSRAKWGPTAREEWDVRIEIRERRVNLLLRAIGAVIRRVWPGHLCFSILLAGLVGCSTTPGVLVNARSQVFSPVPSGSDEPKVVAIFLNWYQGCVLGECDTPRAELRHLAAACINSGLQRVNSDILVIAGPVELPQDTSALVADPREHGQADSRFDDDLIENLRKEEVRYAVVLDISRIQGVRGWATRVEPVTDGTVAGLIIERIAGTPIHIQAEAILIDLDSRRWLARIRREFKDSETFMAGVGLPSPKLPIPRFRASNSSAGLSACEGVGEALGYVLSGQQGPRPFGERGSRH